MSLRTICCFLIGTAGIAGVMAGCAEETKLSKSEEATFKGSRDMSEEARKHMAEGMKWQADYYKKMGEKNGQTGTPPPTK
jgi:hypothetical protein